MQYQIAPGAQKQFSRESFPEHMRAEATVVEDFRFCHHPTDEAQSRPPFDRKTETPRRTYPDCLPDFP